MVCRLIRIRHLHRDLGLDLPAIDCLLRMRRQVVNLQRRLSEVEQQMLARERELMDEVQRLRRKIAHNSNWQKR
jgi:DNA-binding transcriptional MerR regulator